MCIYTYIYIHIIGKHTEKPAVESSYASKHRFPPGQSRANAVSCNTSRMESRLRCNADVTASRSPVNW